MNVLVRGFRKSLILLIGRSDERRILCGGSGSLDSHPIELL